MEEMQTPKLQADDEFELTAPDTETELTVFHH